ncbi:MAG: 4Fe-4S binding protein [Coriobacteriia bacterium]|nr:4Fe-4S binding protein [Coriobacteriia bacterium]MBS5478063.1 4Fe-4S binding protein [Coriobacteriia bacterium]
MPQPIIDTDECTACGSCVDACPMGVLDIEDEVAKVVDEESCIACDSCLESCPSGAITEISDDED